MCTAQNCQIPLTVFFVQTLSVTESCKKKDNNNKNEYYYYYSFPQSKQCNFNTQLLQLTEHSNISSQMVTSIEMFFRHVLLSDVVIII